MFYLGISHYYVAQYHLSNDYYLKALATKYARDHLNFRDRNFNNIGVNFDLLGNYSKALDYYLKSYEISLDRNDSAGMADAEVNLGLLYLNLKLFKEAKEYTFKAQRYYRLHNNNQGLGLTYHNLGKLYNNLQMHDSAAAVYPLALKSYKEAGNQYEYINILANLANFYLAMEDYKRCDSVTEAGLISCEAAGYNYPASRLRLLAAESMLKQGRLQEAEDFLSNNFIPNSITKLRHQQLQLKLFAARHDYQNLIDSLDQFLTFNDSLNSTYSRHLLKEVEARQKVWEQEQEMIQRNQELKATRMRTRVLLIALVVLLTLLSVIIWFYFKLQRSYYALFLQDQRKASHFLVTDKTPTVNLSDSADETEKFTHELWPILMQELKKDDRFADPNLNADMLAQACSTNKSYIYRCTKDCHGHTFMELVNELRVEKARNLLRDHPAYGTLHIAELSGFSSKSSFYRIFKEYTGLTPSKYRDFLQD